MKKKELLERRDALKVELKAQLDAFQQLDNGPSDEDWAAYKTKEEELADIGAKLDRITEVEESARSFAASEISNPGPELAAEKPYDSFGEFLQCVANAQTPGRRVDPRLQEELAISGGSEKVGADGGFLVKQDHSTMLLERAQEEAILAPRCTPVPISNDSNSIVLPLIKETSRATGSRWGGVRMYRRDEGDTVTATKPSLDNIEIKVEPVMGIAYATEELLSDASAISAIYGKAFASEYAFKQDDEIFNGNGTGRCLGILNAACLVSQTKETGQSAATIVAENISKMWTRIPARSKTRGVWVINGEITEQLDSLNIAVGTGGQLVYMPAQGLAAAPLGTIKGRPIVEIEQAAALGTVGDIVFCDFDEYLLATKGGLTGEQSMHVRFLYNEMTFRWTARFNGQPGWLSALTAYKGSASKSPFVALETRS